MEGLNRCSTNSSQHLTSKNGMCIKHSMQERIAYTNSSISILRGGDVCGISQIVQPPPVVMQKNSIINAHAQWKPGRWLLLVPQWCQLISPSIDSGPVQRSLLTSPSFGNQRHPYILKYAPGGVAESSLASPEPLVGILALEIHDPGP